MQGTTGGDDHAGLAVIGVPTRLGSLTPGRCDLAPGAIREALAKFSTYDVVTGFDVADVTVSDQGDLAVEGLSIEDAFGAIRDGLSGSFAGHNAAVILGGDNSVTRPGVHSLEVDFAQVGLVTLDAHLDMRSTEGGLTNGNPVRALIEDGLPGENVWQIGIQSFANSRAYFEWGRDQGAHCVTMEEVHSAGIEAALSQAFADLRGRCQAVYFDLDLDVLDEAFGQGCPGSRPGGLMPWQVVAAARYVGAQPEVVAMDLVELDPTLDTTGETARVAAMSVLAFCSGMLQLVNQ